jgi:hypothetical protein
MRPWLTRHPDECPIGFGNRSGYTRHECRCPWCTWGNSVYLASYRRQAVPPATPDSRPVQLTFEGTS